MSDTAKTFHPLARKRAHRPLVWVFLGATAVAGIAVAARAQAPAASTAVKDDDADTADAPSPPGARAPSPTVKIVFKINPPTKATITWGKKKLGLIKPKDRLVVERPRDSGPLDVVVRAEGCLPVHTRAYTFTDSVVNVKVTTIDKKNTLFGYREAPPPDADGGTTSAPGNPDGGVVPTL